jgi:hypothetical protein
MPSAVTVHYPFHPHHRRCLEVLAWPRNACGAATVVDPGGKTLKIPLWMLEPEAARYRLSIERCRDIADRRPVGRGLVARRML